MIVTEFCPDGCLRTKLGWGGEYQWKGKGRKLMRDVAAGLAYLHASRIIHFDLTSSNVLIVHGTCAKITGATLAGSAVHPVIALLPEKAWKAELNLGTSKEIQPNCTVCSRHSCQKAILWPPQTGQIVKQLSDTTW